MGALVVNSALPKERCATIVRFVVSDSLEKNYRSSFSTADRGPSSPDLRSTPRQFSCMLKLPSVLVGSGALGDLRHAPNSSTLMHSISEISLGVARLFCRRELVLAFCWRLMGVCSFIDLSFKRQDSLLYSAKLSKREEPSKPPNIHRLLTKQK